MLDVLYLLTCVAMLAVSSGSSPDHTNYSTTASPLVQFQDDNFGVRFSHSDALKTTYNPHGGALFVMISFRDRPVGGLKITPSFPISSITQFIESGKEYYKNKYHSSSIEYALVTTPNKIPFHHFRIKATIEGSPCIIDRYVYLREKDDTPKDDIPSSMLAGSFSFEFLVPESELSSIEPEIKTVINTFHIAATP